MDKAKESKKMKDVSYTIIVYRNRSQAQESDQRKMHLAIPNEKEKKMLKDLEGLKRSFQSVLPNPIELSW